MPHDTHKLKITLLTVSLLSILAISIRISKAESKSDSATNAYFPVARVTLAKRSEGEVQFRVENCGTRRLVLNELDCDCRPSKASQLVILPGTSRSISLNLQDSQVNEPDLSVRYSTNDPNQPVIEIKLDSLETSAPRE